MTSNLARLRGRLALIVAVVVVVVASLSVAMLSTAGATTHHRRHHRSCIPQHNGGDRDADNRGGPSDGDGCL